MLIREVNSLLCQQISVFGRINVKTVIMAAFYCLYRTCTRITSFFDCYTDIDIFTCTYQHKWAFPLSCSWRKRGIEHRRSNNEPVAGFFTHIGEQSVVHHLWGMSTSKIFFLHITVPLKVIVFPLDSPINSSLVMYQNDTDLNKFSQITECLSKTYTCIYMYYQPSIHLSLFLYHSLTLFCSNLQSLLTVSKHVF